MTDWSVGPGDRSSRGWTRLSGYGARPAHLDEELIHVEDRRPPETALEAGQTLAQLPNATSAEIVPLRPSEAAIETHRAYRQIAPRVWDYVDVPGPEPERTLNRFAPMLRDEPVLDPVEGLRAYARVLRRVTEERLRRLGISEDDDSAAR